MMASSTKTISSGSFVNNNRRLLRADTRDSVMHTYHDEEKQGLVEHVNFLLRKDQRLSTIIPIDPQSDSIFASLADGVILCKLINAIRPGVINEKDIKLSNKLNIFEKNVNLDICLKSARTIGCYVINIGPTDFHEGKRHLILSILWQLVKLDLLNKVSRLASRVKAEILDLGAMDNVDEMVPDEILIRWVNHHLANAKSDRRVSNFASDIRDSEVYIILFNQLAPKTCTLDALNEPDLSKRATMFLESAAKIQCRKFITTDDIVNANGRLNIAFIAYVFNKFNQLADEEPVIPSEVIKSADEKIAANTATIVQIESAIQLYQSRAHESKEKIDQMRRRINTVKVENLNIQEKFEDKAKDYAHQWDQQRSTYTVQVKQLEEELTVLQTEAPMTEEQLQEEYEKEAVIIKQLEHEAIGLSMNLAQIKGQVQVAESDRKECEVKLDSAKVDLEREMSVLQVEMDAVKARLDATGITDAKRKLEQAKAETKQLSVNIEGLKKEEKVLMHKLYDARDDKNRIESARRMIQDQLNAAKENTDRVVRTRIDTERGIDSATRNVKELKMEVDRFKNDTVYIKKQTEVIKVETNDVEEHLDTLRREKKRLEIKREEITEELSERKLDLDITITEKKESVKALQGEHREALGKLKRDFDRDKNELYDERAEMKVEMLKATTELVREAYATENVQREVEVMAQHNRSYTLDIHMEGIERQVTEEKIERTAKEKTRTLEQVELEKQLNQELEKANQQLIDRKQRLRKSLEQASIELLAQDRQTVRLDSANDELRSGIEDTQTEGKRVMIRMIEEEAELDNKKSELSEEKRRLKGVEATMYDKQKQAIETVDVKYGREMLKLNAIESIKSKELGNIDQQVAQMGAKQLRLESRLERTRAERKTEQELLDHSLSERGTAEEKKRELERKLMAAMVMIEDASKEKDGANLEMEVTSMKLKKVKDGASVESKRAHSMLATKKEMEQRLARVAKEIADKESEVEVWREEQEDKSRAEIESVRGVLAKDTKKRLSQIEQELSEQEENLMKKKEAKITSISNNNAKLFKDIVRMGEKKEGSVTEQEPSTMSFCLGSSNGMMME
ncbi:hypothetical protein SAMD00019534_030380 [Acytostelium subglobosum LB1]|uniref:hypothetical protein n=1 Tax=Acytostelium subglobosum LB1 TaxID=1410327 RepID=UPI00064502FF|nr:hypothetical protein SAMD00019534_030380 [Acytostelium subglobosum LB1]GAM19863.1 hypothetical protein SAMD00019534_030380 [Acytostelium subglobosum LB1]|eukprot:XP_012756625.1 hypothetical protein SAMD00019534_030380 [Acytostelium subglobosum LB1]